jgi:two-component system OmpR family response regulator
MKTAVLNSDLKIGIVDDDNLFTIMTEKELFKRDFTKFKSYASGEEYFSDATSDFDILILDYHLDSINAQAMDGLEILKRIKKNNPNTKVLMMSGDDDVKVAQDALKYGACEYIVKSKTASTRLELALNSIRRSIQLKREIMEDKKVKIKMTVIFVAVFALFFSLNYFFPGIFNEK